MWVKINFLIYLLVCFIGGILCDNFTPFNTAPRKQYYFSEPTKKVDLVDATSWCSSMHMTLATADNVQDQKMLLRQLRKDYSRHTTFGPSEFWLVDPNGLNQLQRVLALPYSNARKCVKLVFTPFNVEWTYDTCQGRHRFICTGNSYSLRNGQTTEPAVTLLMVKQALQTVKDDVYGLFKKLFKKKLLATKAYTKTEITELLRILKNYLGTLLNVGEPEMHICKETPKKDFAGQLLFEVICKDGLIISKATALGAYNTKKQPIEPLRHDMETMIPIIRKDLNWSQKKAKKVTDMMVDVLKFRDPAKILPRGLA